MDTEHQSHWEDVFRKKKPEAMSWYQPSLQVSLELIRSTGVGPGAAIIDIGGGASTLVDDLLALNFSNITVLDISASALELARTRLGNRSGSVIWVRADITGTDLSASSFEVWHDRALFHFLTTQGRREQYCRVLTAAVQPGGHAIIATFGLNGPRSCSGLEVARYDADSLARTIGDSFSLVTTRTEQHRTPSNAVQEFVYCLFRRNENHPGL